MVNILVIPIDYKRHCFFFFFFFRGSRRYKRNLGFVSFRFCRLCIPTLLKFSLQRLTNTMEKNTAFSSSAADTRCTYNQKEVPADVSPSSPPARDSVKRQTAESDQEVGVGQEGSSSLTPDSSEDGPSHEDAPDGGLTAWLVVLGAWCSSFCSYGWINSK